MLRFWPGAVSVSLLVVRETTDSLPSESGFKMRSSIVRSLPSSLAVCSVR